VHRDVLGLLDEDWQPRTTLLSPFDNLIGDRDRTERLWGLAYHNKMYVPKHKRQFGYYVMPFCGHARPLPDGDLADRFGQPRYCAD
jgi:uncharacterized protein YcaQ